MSKKRLVFATGNQGKVNEFRQMLGDDYEILSMKDIGVDIDIVEDGKTFEENAVIKAKAVMEETGEMVLADDSGFEVDYLIQIRFHHTIVNFTVFRCFFSVSARCHSLLRILIST